MSTLAEIQALPAETFPQIGKASDNGNWYIVAPNETGSTAEKIGPEVAASLVASGTVELATIAETDTGTDVTRAVTPAGLAGSALQAKANEASNKTANLLSLTLVGDSSNDVKAYTLGEWVAMGVITANWKLNATTLTSLHIGQGVTSIGANAFDGCTGLKGNLVIPNSVTAIGVDSFQGCSGFTGTLTLNEGLLEIFHCAFEDCSGFTGNLVIPDSVTTMSEEAFRDFGTGAGTLTLGSGLTEIDEAAFKCANFTGPLVIPVGVTHIKDEAFELDSGQTGGFTSLTLPEGLTRIGDETFEDCNFTGTLTLPDSLTKIDDEAFSGCDGFTGDLTIPNNVTEIEEEAFKGCTGFVDVYINLAAGSVEDNVFNGPTGNIYVHADHLASYGGADATYHTTMTVKEWTSYPDPMP